MKMVPATNGVKTDRVVSGVVEAAIEELEEDLDSEVVVEVAGVSIVMMIKMEEEEVVLVVVGAVVVEVGSNVNLMTPVKGKVKAVVSERVLEVEMIMVENAVVLETKEDLVVIGLVVNEEDLEVAVVVEEDLVVAVVVTEVEEALVVVAVETAAGVVVEVVEETDISIKVLTLIVQHLKTKKLNLTIE